MRRFVIVPVKEDPGPLWTGGTPQQQGYHILPIPKLKRPNARDNEYYVYSSATEYKAVDAESAMAAVAASEIKVPFKVIHMHVRLPSVIDVAALEYTGKDAEYLNLPDVGSKKVPDAAKADKKVESAPGKTPDIAGKPEEKPTENPA